MRTKTLLCAAALAAGIATSAVAQSNVYSLNVVGYVNVVLPAGYSVIANPLNAANNSVTNLFASLNPAGSAVYTWNGSFFVLNQLDEFGGGWSDNTLQLPPGKGFFFQNVSGGPLTNTFVGEVLQGSLTNTPPSGYSVLSSKVPQSGFVQDLALNATPGDAIYMWNGSFFVLIQKDEFDGTWSQPAGFTIDPNKGPNINIGQGFFYQNIAGTATWVRNFTVQ